jgi:FtsH-binding integral membrane protein
MFASQTNWDFTLMGGALYVATIILFIFGLVLIFIPGKTIMLIYASYVALLFSLYFIYDAQLMIMVGKHKNVITPEDCSLAALNLYLDLVRMSLFILISTGASQN